MYLVLLIAAALLADCRSANVHKHMKHLEVNNRIEHGSPAKPTVIRRLFTIMQKPKESYAHVPGTTLSLTCEVLGAPAPSIHWFKNDAPVYEYDMESNELIDVNPTSIARVSSTLLITKTTDEDVYSCLMAAGSKTARSTTLVYRYREDGSTELTDRYKLYPLAPRIVVSYKMYLDEMGSNIVLPCRAKGHPRPKVTWFNDKNVTVTHDTRMKVLRSGELVISSLRWTDMGEFTCHATNVFGTQTAKTFVYPAKAG